MRGFVRGSLVGMAATAPATSPDTSSDKPAKPADDKPAKPKALPPFVLVENRRRGIVGGTRSLDAPAKPDGSPNYTVHQIMLNPGLNLVPSKDWVLHANGLEHRIAESMLVVHGDEGEGVYSHHDAAWARTREPVALDAIRETGDLEVLRKLLEHEERPRIAKAIEAQISVVERGGVAARRANEAHARR